MWMPIILFIQAAAGRTGLGVIYVDISWKKQKLCKVK